MNALEIKDLVKVYNKNQVAINGVSLSVPLPSIFAIIGPNGAGKSTIINILAGILKKTSGEITILGKQLDNSDYEYKRKVGFVLEQPHYLEKLTIKEYLHFVGAMYELDEKEIFERTKELIHFFGLEEKENIRIEKYSKGMKKKVSLAAAMIHQPNLYILDEPLEGIDPTSAKHIKDNFRLMARKGVTVVISSHNLDTVEKFCDEVAIISNGKIIFQSKTGDIRKKIKNEINQEVYNSLEEIFVDLVSEKGVKKEVKKLSWL